MTLDECRSTMEEAEARAPMLTGPTWIHARRQTAGQATRGRTWTDPPGNLAATLIYRPEATPAEAARRSFLAALAVFETLAMAVDRDRLAVKWPNDVLLDGGKVAGILLRSRGAPYVDWLAIGIGINLASAPKLRPDMSLRPVHLDGALTPDDALTLLAENFATQERKLDAFGFRRIRDDWIDRAARLGELIEVRIGHEVIEGIFESVDREGNLVVATHNGPRAIAAAEVLF
ncbi:MAG: biotin--[acetyl-CoA-carboxylase] ligase [Paracoccaceae bacterium]